MSEEQVNNQVNMDQDSSESQEQTQEQQTKQDVKPTPKPSVRRYKVGEKEIALSDDDIARDYSKWQGADAKFQEAAKMRKEIEAFQRQIQENPEVLLEQLGPKKYELAQQWLLESIQQQLYPEDPKDAKIREYEQKLQQIQAEEQRKAQEAEQARVQEAVARRRQEISETLSKAMEATPLSSDPEVAASTLREMALYMRAAAERGEEVSVEDIVSHVQNTKFQSFYRLAAALDGEQLVSFLGDDIVKKIRKHDLQRLKASRSSEQPQQDQSWSSSSPSEKSPKRIDTYSARMRN